MFKVNRAATEIASVGMMRGIASAMVCYFHLAHENPRLPDSSTVKQLGTWGWAGVEVFFIISGFVIPYSMFIKNYSIGQFGTFLKKRLIRIEPPYLISIVLVLVLSWLSTLLPTYGGQPLNIDWANVAGHIGYLNIFTGQKWLQDVYWTLAIEFQFYLLLSFTYSLIGSGNIYKRLVFYCLFLSAVLLSFTGGGFIFAYTGFFMLGILLFQYYCRLVSNTEFWILLSVNLAVLCYSNGALLTGLSVVTLLLIAFVKKVPAILKFLGTISFSLYLVHIPVGGRLNNLTAVFTPNVHVREAMVFVAFAVSIFTAYIFYISIEKKCKDLAAAIRYGNAPAERPAGTAS